MIVKQSKLNEMRFVILNIDVVQEAMAHAEYARLELYL
jgi:hypothetical protein